MELHEELFGQVKHERLTDELFGVDTKPSDFATATALFESRGWEPRLSGFGILTAPLYTGRYYYLSRSMDTKTIIPQEGLDRLEALDELGIQYQQMIIGHEVKKPEKGKIVEVDWLELGQRAKESALTATRIVGGAMVGMANLLASSVLLLDPRLSIVLNDHDNPWFEVYKWFDKSGE